MASHHVPGDLADDAPRHFISSPGAAAPGGTVSGDVPVEHPIEFTGSGSEYFRIWIVNLLLSVLTLGIYSAWAKVRSQRYLHANTRLDGASFGYHARPAAILKGRIVAVLLLIAYVVLTQEMQLTGLLIVLVAAVVLLPWLLYRSLRFRLANTSYRALRFGFQAPLRKSYVVFALWPVLTLFTLYLLTPFTHRAIKAFQHNHSRYGSARFSFDARTRDFYLRYGAWLAGVVLAGGLPVLAAWLFLRDAGAGGMDGAEFFSVAWIWIYAVLLATTPMLAASLRNLIWSRTRLGPNRIVSRVSPWKYFYIQATNGLLTLLTLGLFVPFARIRRLRYLAACTAFVAAGDIGAFVAAAQDGPVGAAGDETADIFGIDIAL